MREKKLGCSPLTLLSNIILKVLVNAIKQEKEISSIQIRKGDIKLTLFADDIVVCVKDSKKSTTNPP